MRSVSARGMVCFDIDGTLVPGGSSGEFLAERLGHLDSLRAAELRYEQGLLDNPDVCRIDALGWTGRSRAEVDGWLAGLPLVAGISETTDWCHANNLTPVLASLAWSVVGSHLAARFGFDAWGGPELDEVGGMFTGAVARACDEQDKCRDAWSFPFSPTGSRAHPRDRVSLCVRGPGAPAGSQPHRAPAHRPRFPRRAAHCGAVQAPAEPASACCRRQAGTGRGSTGLSRAW